MNFKTEKQIKNVVSLQHTNCVKCSVGNVDISSLEGMEGKVLTIFNQVPHHEDVPIA
jgi:hypothetical protein